MMNNNMFEVFLFFRYFPNEADESYLTEKGGCGSCSENTKTSCKTVYCCLTFGFTMTTRPVA